MALHGIDSLEQARTLDEGPRKESRGRKIDQTSSPTVPNKTPAACPEMINKQRGHKCNNKDITALTPAV